MTLRGEDFVVQYIQSNNFILKIIAEKLIEKEADNIISISIIDNVAYISCNKTKRCIEFYRDVGMNGEFYSKRKKSHIAKLFIKEVSHKKEAYFILEKHGKRRMKISLIQTRTSLH